MATRAKAKNKANKRKSTNKRAAHGYSVTCGLVAESTELPGGLERQGTGNYWVNQVRADTVFLATRLALDISKESKRAEDAHVLGASLAIKVEAYSRARGHETVRAEIQKQWTAACKKFGAKINPAPAGRPDYLRSDYFTITFKSGREFVFYPDRYDA